MDVWVTTVNRRMQKGFRGGSSTIKRLTLGINGHDVLNGQPSLVTPRDGNGNPPVRKSSREVAAGGRDPASLVDKASGINQLLCKGVEIVCHWDEISKSAGGTRGANFTGDGTS